MSRDAEFPSPLVADVLGLGTDDVRGLVAAVDLRGLVAAEARGLVAAEARGVAAVDARGLATAGVRGLTVAAVRGLAAADVRLPFGWALPGALMRFAAVFMVLAAPHGRS